LRFVWLRERPAENPAANAAQRSDGPATALAKKSAETQIRLSDAPATENLEGERKTVATLFVDIKGSMESIEDLDPEKARAIVDLALRLMMYPD
jgi:class 3 adenylate cyclase